MGKLYFNADNVFCDRLTLGGNDAYSTFGTKVAFLPSICYDNVGPGYNAKPVQFGSINQFVGQKGEEIGTIYMMNRAAGKTLDSKEMVKVAWKNASPRRLLIQ